MGDVTEVASYRLTMDTPHSTPDEAHAACPASWHITQCAICGEVLLTLTDVDTRHQIRTKLANVTVIDSMIISLQHARAAIVAREVARN